MKPTLLLLLPLFFFAENLAAQTAPHPCGTRDGKLPWLEKYQQDPTAYRNGNDTLYVPMSVHLVGTDAGTGYFTLTSLHEAFCTLNNDFAEANIRFYIAGEINYIANSGYNEHEFPQGEEMMELYRVPGTLNTYFVSDPAGNCGYSSYNLGVAMNKGCSGPDDHTWAHEIGHFLSLPHPFWGWEGHSVNLNLPAPLQWDDILVERLDGVDCHLAADGFCDTPADYLNYRWPCNADSFSQQIQTDPNGETFYSDGSFFMSYAFDNCMGRFSEEQMAAMRANLFDEKPDHLQTSLPDGPITLGDPILITPAQGAFVAIHENILFEWEAVPNATGYFLEITIFENFNTVLYRIFVEEGTSAVVPSVPKNRTIYWRVRPFNSSFTCSQYSEQGSFESGDLASAVSEIKGLSGFSVQPNPVPSGSPLVAIFSASANMQAEVLLLDDTGRTVSRSTQDFAAGKNQFPLASQNLAPGLYFLQLRDETGVASLRFVVE